VREWRARKNARAVIRLFVAIGTEDLIICAILIVVLEEVVRPRRPLDQLASFEFIQPLANLACVLRLRDQEKKHVMKEIVHYEQSDGDRRRQYEYRSHIQ
jgi:hypothetical protein